MDQALIKSEPAKILTDRLNTIIQAFLLSLDVKLNSREAYERGLKQFFSWITAQAIHNPTRETILAYKQYLESQRLSALTISNYLVACRKFFEYAEGMKFYPNIAKSIRGAKRPKGFLKDALTVSQIKELLGSIDRSIPEGKRTFALINLLIRTGLRAIEVHRANVGDIRQNGEALLYVHGKGRDSKDEFVLLTDATLKPITDYLNTRGNLEDGDPLFISFSDRSKNKRLSTRAISMIVKESLRKIGLNSKRLTCHSTRHTAVTIALLGGASLQSAQALARHNSILTTTIYAQNLDRISQAAERNIDTILSEPDSNNFQGK